MNREQEEYGMRRPGTGLSRYLVAGALAASAWFGACADGAPDGPAGGGPAAAVDGPGPVTAPGTDIDWGIVREKTRWAYAEGINTLPMGELVARIGESFVGTKYSPHTLEAEGPEGLVIELEELDCVTFVENVLALARFVKSAPPIVMNEERVLRGYYSGILTRIRYRDGEIDAYPSRLHYFSEWIDNNDEMGIVTSLAEELGGVSDPEPIDFMTTHVDAYRQLAEFPAFVDEVRAAEERLSARGRFFIPEDQIAAISDRIQDGDIIAATSTVEGLDVAHTGIALWIDGTLHLLHAPLVGEAVQISEVSLSERILRIEGQDGIMIARPSEPSE